MTGNGGSHKLKIFSGRANRPLAEGIAKHLGVPLGNINLGSFPDGETMVRIDEDVRGRDVFLVQPTCPPVNQHLMELLTMLDAFKRASPARITAVMPYYGYARQDRKDTGRVPITAKLVADLLTTAGAHRVLCLDLHAAQIQGFFNIPVDHLYASNEITAYVRSLNIPQADLVVLSTDEGNVKKSLKYQGRLGGQIAVVDKQRLSATETKAAHLIGASVEGKTVVVFDDMISTGSSMVKAIEVARTRGCKRVFACATHGLLVDKAIGRLRDAGIEQIAITDSIPLPPEKQLPNIKVISVAALLANAIRRIHEDQSISELFTD
ncbi:MAG TPA: ribose-phosphate pyrophosphokinase [Urbifossiella sp.]|nr:ribose-phosphate pyrophosphokinase [Urbifossiella sp.]